MRRLEVRLLGGFGVKVDSREIVADAWEHSRAQQLVKLLALEPKHAMPRDRVVEALWPHLDSAAGVSNLHKAASYAPLDHPGFHGDRAMWIPGASS